MNDDVYGQLRIGKGALSVESGLLRDIAALIQDSVDATERLTRPLRVIVPSGSLRDHLCVRILEEAARPVLGLRVQTLSGVAREILEHIDETPGDAELIFPIIVRQEAAREPSLRDALDPLENGYAAATATVSDLLDAGLEEQHSASLDRLLAERRPESGARERARALVRVALATTRRLNEAGRYRESDRLLRASRVLDESGAEALPACALLIHGFAETTGRAGALIETLVRSCHATVYLDYPPDPLDAHKEDPGVVFAHRLRERLQRVTQVDANPPQLAAKPVELRFSGAAGLQAEVRAAARRIDELLEGGAEPEGIAVVARNLERHALPLRVHLGRLGIPFSAREHRGSRTPAGRRVQAVADLLQLCKRTPVDRWLDASDALVHPSEGTARADLSLALHALGAGRLADAAELDLEARLGSARGYPLPVRSGLSAGDELDADESAPRAQRRFLARDALESCVGSARALCDCLESWRAETRGAGHLQRLRDLLERELGWRSEDRVRIAGELVAMLEVGIPDELPLSLAEFAAILRRCAAQCGLERLGGAGGGVQLLDVTEARARTFRHLLLLGVNRDSFPRRVAEDPLLRDAIRRDLRSVLPDLPLKRLGRAEERYLYAQLLSSSPRVDLSWQTLTDDGKSALPSAFIVRHRIGATDLHFETVPSLWELATATARRPAHEQAVLAGLHGNRKAFEDAFRVAMRESLGEGDSDPDALASARLATLAEQEPDRLRARELGPFFGFIGPISGSADPRSAALYVTTLESLARCPWRTLVERVLRIEPRPDALDSLPELDVRILGTAVHRALERITTPVAEESGQPLETIRMREPTSTAWPDPESLNGLLSQVAGEVLRDEGIVGSALGAVLVEQARPYMERARQLIFSQPQTRVYSLGTEVQGQALVNDAEGHERSIHFRADLAERNGDELLLTDYKTGRTISDRKKESTRRSHFLEEIASGRSLQALAYLMGAGPKGAAARYAFLSDTETPEARVFSAREEDTDLIEAFLDSTRALLRGWDAGSFFPRLLDTKGTEPRVCGTCSVAEACLQRDSGARARLKQWLAERDRQPTRQLEAESSLIEIWRLAEPGPR